MRRTPLATVTAAPRTEPGARPSNSHERSSRSWARASLVTSCGWFALRWIRARVCSTESWTREAMSARSSARARACRSTTRSRAIRSHQGPSSTMIAEATRITPPSGRSSSAPSCPISSRARPPISSRPARAARATVADRLPGPAMPSRVPAPPSSGSVSRRMVSCSSSGAFRQISARPATLMASGQDRLPIQLAPTTEARTNTTISSDPRAAASAMPRRSVIARPAMVPSSSAIGMNSQART